MSVREARIFEDDGASTMRWFSRSVWLGIAANVALAVATLLAPEPMLALAQLPPATPIMWPRFAALLLLLLSAFYVPAAIDPQRYSAAAWLAVAARLAGVVFFLGPYRSEYGAMGLVDLAFFVPQAALLAWSTISVLAARVVGQPA